MVLKTVIKTDKGDFEFAGTFSPEEERVIYEAGLNYLFKMGALPLSMVDIASFGPGSDSAQ